MAVRKVYIESFGCQMNKLDTALIRSALKGVGFVISESVEEADGVLINTCSVREHAEQRVFSHLGYLKHLKKSRPQLVVGVVGCMAQRLGDKLLEHEAVNIVCGPGQIAEIPGLLQKAFVGSPKNVSVTDDIRRDSCDVEAFERFERLYNNGDGNLPGQAFVRAMRGCDNFCSYCVVPYVRGPEVSCRPQAVVEQVKKLADGGVKQVTLLGQTINSYKYVCGEKIYCLADLLEMVSEVAGIRWIRFITSYPSESFFDEIVSAMADLPKVCNYLHMPAQSGSDKILRAMNRHYTAGEYLRLLAKARDAVAGLSVAGDFIVGFPGETEEDFRETVLLVKKACYKNCFVFKYSPRPGTVAEKRRIDNIPPDVKRERNSQLLAVQREISEKLNRVFLKRRELVLVEGLSKKPHLDDAGGSKEPQLIGRTATDHIVVFNGPVSLAGSFVEVEITKTAAWTLFGRLQGASVTA